MVGRFPAKPTNDGENSCGNQLKIIFYEELLLRFVVRGKITAGEVIDRQLAPMGHPKALYFNSVIYM
jgi:hypothetical protein